MSEEPLTVDTDERGVATVVLNRPEVKNAFDADLIDRLGQTFQRLTERDSVRLVVLTGAGDSFCAGADLGWMSGMVDYSYEENLADSRDFEAMLRAVHGLPVPLLARVNGHALGGGMGLVACADVAVAVRDAVFGFTEVRLGLAPAVISPYVLPKIGDGHARRYFLTGERFDASTATDMGLVNVCVAADDLDDAVDDLVGSLLAGGPRAQREVKSLLRAVTGSDPAAAAELTSDLIARLRVSEEGQEGMAAFFEKREPAWR